MNFTYWLCLGYAFGIWTLSKRGTIQATGDQGFVLWPEYCLSQEGVINMKAIHNFVFCVEELKVFQHPAATKEHNEMCWVLLSGPSMALHLQWCSVLYGFLQWCFEGRIALDAFFLQKAEGGVNMWKRCVVLQSRASPPVVTGKRNHSPLSGPAPWLFSFHSYFFSRPAQSW